MEELQFSLKQHLSHLGMCHFCRGQLYPPEVSASTPLSSATFRKIWKGMISVNENQKRRDIVGTASEDATREQSSSSAWWRYRLCGFSPVSRSQPVTSCCPFPMSVLGESQTWALSHVSETDLVTKLGRISYFPMSNSGHTLAWIGTFKELDPWALLN